MITPIRTQILFKPFPPPELTEGGLIVPDSVKKINNKGTIVKVGSGIEGKPMRLKEGQVGYRVKDWGEAIIENNETYFLMDMSAIICLE